MDDATRLARCTRCGAELPADAPGGLCPACLLALAAPSEDATISSEDTQWVGSASSSDHATVLASASDASRAAARFSTQLEPGQLFGPYRIEKLLGRGGMGEVYAAEHLEHGRRLAVKVLSHRLADRDDRARFLREGQLAASINHPRSVYIFGSEEIDGAPIITMELVPGGTLKDKVTADGPYAPAAAVDAILDIVSGLDAAHIAGIFHRDIKPSNCFVDYDGSVKIGDFGLSISTLARDLGSGVAWLFQLVFMAALGLVSPVIVPGGFAMRQLGLAVVDRTGREISRWRSLGQAVVAWSPILLLVVPLYGVSGTMQPGWRVVAAGLVATFVVGAGYAIVHPTRGLQDRLVGTWLVPR